MTQQDDITQRVLTDDEIRDIITGTHQAFGEFKSGYMLVLGRAIESALLSKLRAPVADERAAFEAWALTEFTHPFMVPDPLIEDPDGSGDYVNRDVQMAWAGFQQACAALASAPVAARQYHYRMPNCTPGRHECRTGNGYPECPCWHDVGTGPLAGKEVTATHWRDKPSAPVAGEATDTFRNLLLEAVHRYGNARALAEHDIKQRGQISTTVAAILDLLDAAPQASAETAIIGLSERDRHHVREFINCDGLGSMVVEGPRYSAVVRALKTQADKDGAQWEPQTPEQIAADMRNMARSEGFDWPEPDGGQQRAGDEKEPL